MRSTTTSMAPAGERGDVLELDGGDQRTDDGGFHVMDDLVGLLIDGVHLGHSLFDFGRVEIVHNLSELLGGLTGELGGGGEAVEVERVVFLSHGGVLSGWFERV